MQAKQRVSAPRRSQLASRPPAADEVRGLPLPKTSEGTILTAQPSGIRECRLRNAGERMVGLVVHMANAGLLLPAASVDHFRPGSLGSAGKVIILATGRAMQRNCLSILLSGSIVLSTPALAATDCSAVLIPKISQFRTSMQKWLSLLNVVDRGSSSSDANNAGFGYAGIDLNYSDAQSAAEFYKQRTKYSLAESESLSLSTSELDPKVAQAFVECVKGSKQDISIHAPSGSENQEGFQIQVTWTPTYSVKVIDGSTDRLVELNMNSNGKLASSIKKRSRPLVLLPSMLYAKA